MLDTTDDIRIREIKALDTPAQVMGELPRDAAVTRTVTDARSAIRDPDWTPVFALRNRGASEMSSRPSRRPLLRPPQDRLELNDLS